MWKNTASEPVLSNRSNNNEMEKKLPQSIPVLPKVGNNNSNNNNNLSYRSNRSCDGFVP